MTTEIVILEAQARDRVGKGAARATRRAGRIPAVIYGDKKEPIAISLDPKVLGRELHRRGFFSHLVDTRSRMSRCMSISSASPLARARM
jgi:large subunit ribosomal protein L25